MIFDIKGIARDFLNTLPFYVNISSLGSYGNIVFQVSENTILTPKEVQVSIGSRVNKFTRLGAVDITEFKTRELKKVTLPIKLVRELCSLNSTIRELTRICENGEHYPLILAKKRIGEHNFRLESFSYNYSQTDGIGEPLVVEATLTLEEYIEDIDRDGISDIVEKKENNNPEKLSKLVYVTNKLIIKELEKRCW